MLYFQREPQRLYFLIFLLFLQQFSSWHTKPKELGRILIKKIKTVDAALKAFKAERTAFATEYLALEKDKKKFDKDVVQGLGDVIRFVFHKWILTAYDAIVFSKAVQPVFTDFKSI